MSNCGGGGGGGGGVGASGAERLAGWKPTEEPPHTHTHLANNYSPHLKIR